MGRMCETRVWCVKDPCVNGGRCVDLPDGYECKNFSEPYQKCVILQSKLFQLVTWVALYKEFDINSFKGSRNKINVIK